MHKHPSATGPSAYTVSWGLGRGGGWEGWGEEEEERRKGSGCPLYPQQHVPSQNGQFHRTFPVRNVTCRPSQFIHFPLFLPFNCYLRSSSIDLATMDKEHRLLQFPI